MHISHIRLRSWVAGCICLTLSALWSCNAHLYPLSTQTRRAYHRQLRDMRKVYRHFIPIQLPLDSLQQAFWIAPSPNFNIRQPDLVIIHQTEEQSCAQALSTLTNPHRAARVSSHYLICKDGTVFQLVPDAYRAWQAGVSRWGYIRDVNSVSIGIELDNTGHEPFADAQIHALLVLLHILQERYHLDTANFIGHADIAPTRKQDPSVYFPWNTLAAHGFGFWPDSVLVDPPADFHPWDALRIIGYDLHDTTAALVAFKRHFIQTDLTPVWDSCSLRVLYNVYQKYRR
jgi:N-acetylmuramoyl-L-alanine amidase